MEDVSGIVGGLLYHLVFSILWNNKDSYGELDFTTNSGKLKCLYVSSLCPSSDLVLSVPRGDITNLARCRQNDVQMLNTRKISNKAHHNAYAWR